MKKKTTIRMLAAVMSVSLAMFIMLTACGAEPPATPATPEPPPQEEITQEQPPLEQQPQEQANTSTLEKDPDDALDIGEGATVFFFQMIDGDGNVFSWNVHTDETTVGAALVEVGLIEGEVSGFGLMVSHVNGVRADYIEDGAYWAFYVDDEFWMVGVDSTDIEEGLIYKFVYTED